MKIEDLRDYRILIQICFFIVFSGNITAQTIVKEIQKFSYGRKESLLSIEKSQIIYSQKSVELNGKRILELRDPRILNIIPIQRLGKNDFVVLTKDDVPNKSDQKLYVYYFDNERNSPSPWSVPLYFDASIPESKVLNDKIIFLRPESQMYSVYGFDGSSEANYSLYDIDEWNHEKKLIYLDNSDNHYIIGMRSPVFDEVKNVSLFKINLSNGHQFLFDLNLSIPYFGSISDEGQFAIVGTRGLSKDYTQTPFLLIGTKANKLNEIQLSILPRQILWLNQTLFLIDDSQILFITGQYENKLKQEMFGHPINSIYSFTLFNSVFTVGAQTMDVSKTGVQYSNIILYEFNEKTGSLTHHSLTKETSSQFKVTQIDQDFYLHSDEKTIHYRIESK